MEEKNIKKQQKIHAILAAIIGISLASSATALDCPTNVGTLFNGVNGGTYCVSKITMTWWSAFTWCEAIGGKLATVQEACLTGGIVIDCPNMKVGLDYTWTATPSSNGKAYRISLSQGRTYNNYTRDVVSGALCQ